MWRVGPHASIKGVSGTVLFLLSEYELEKVDSHTLLSLRSHRPSTGQGYRQRNGFKSFAEGMNNFYLEMKKEKMEFHQSFGFRNSGYLATKILF